MSPRTSGLAESDLIRLALGKDRAELHVGFPAKVLSFDAAGNAVDVQPQLDRTFENIDGSFTQDALPAIASVPVCWPRVGKFGLVFPIEADDYVFVVVSDRNLGEWLRTGARGDALDVGSHVLDGAVALPGLYPLSGALGNEHVTDHLVIGALGSEEATIHIRPADVRLGGDSATQFVALANLVAAELTELKSAIQAAVIVANDGGANFQSTLMTALAAWPSSVAATKVKAL